MKLCRSRHRRSARSLRCLRLFVPALMLMQMLVATPSGAYTGDRVFVQGTAVGDNDAKWLLQAVIGTFYGPLLQHFRCLDFYDNESLQASLDLGRQQQLLGTPEEQQINLTTLAGAVGAKYLINVLCQHQPGSKVWSIVIKGMNTRKANIFYNDTQIFNSVEAAQAALSQMGERLIKGFTMHLSGQKGGGEICPYTGRVDIYRETKLERSERTNQYYACNGQDQEGYKSVTAKAHGQDVWLLERFGNPDTKGTVEAQYEEETVSEEVDRCHVCPSGGEPGEWKKTVTARADSAVKGLSDKSAGPTVNRDATIKLRFNEDGTYSVMVRAASSAGQMHSSYKETVVSPCKPADIDKTVSSGFTQGLEYTFDGFAGTPFDTRLAGKKELTFYDKDTKEQTIVRIDFQLERPTSPN